MFARGYKMGKIKRNERIGAMIKILTDRPNYIYNLNFFSEMFCASKSTISEDVDIIRGIFERFQLGEIRTVTGAAGGIKYIAYPSREQSMIFVKDLCERLSQPDRILPGGFIYMTDLIYMPEIAKTVGEILASQFVQDDPDFVITVETKGIPIAMMTAKALDCPVVIARRDNKVTEGSVVTINYVSASSNQIQTMSLPKRSVKKGQKGLIIDDFMKGGGTVKGIVDILKEFEVEVVGVGVVIATRQPEKKMIDKYKPLMILDEIDQINKKVVVTPAAWI
jgi:purine operon repressor